MQRIKVKDLSFISYIVISLIMSVSIGLTFGVFMFIFSLFGGEVNSSFLFFEAEGIVAGISSIIIAPILFCIIGVILSILSFLPFKLLLSILSGLRIKGNFKAIHIIEE